MPMPMITLVRLATLNVRLRNIRSGISASSPHIRSAR